MTEPAPVRVPGLDEAALLAERLAAVLDEESAMLASARTAAIVELQEKKERLAQGWAACCQALRAHPQAIAAAPAPLKIRLAQVSTRLAGAVERNERLLRAATAATDRVVGAIVGAVREQRNQSAGYARKGVMRQPVHGTAGITLNRAL